MNVERSKNQDRWTVTYRTNQPVSNLVFDRQDNLFRAANWISKSANIVIKKEEKSESITSLNGDHFDTASFEFASYYERTPKDYEFFQPFSDGSLVMYTGHYNACPSNMECDEPIEFTFQGRTTDNIVILGKVNAAKSQWIDQTWRGTYVYFGKIIPLEKKYLTAIIDPAIPSWLKNKFHEVLPKIFDLYTKETGFPLTFKPFVFLSYTPKGLGSQRTGGTLPGLIQMSLSGKGWEKENKNAYVELARFFAHEGAHLWNGQLFHSSSGDMWMHEGGADAFAYFALYKLGLVDQQGFSDLQSGAYTNCVSKLKNRPLKEVLEDPEFRAHYSCGAMAALITHVAVKKKNKTQGLFEFWHALFAKVRNQNLKTYDESMYFSTLSEMSGNQELANRLQKFINGPIENPNKFVRTELENLGIKFSSLEKNIPVEVQKKYAMDIVRLMMDEDCNSKHGVSATNEGIETESFKECKVFTENFLISKIGPHAIKSGAMAYDYAFEICQKAEASIDFTVKGSTDTLKTQCPKSMPKREPAYKILVLPL